MEKVSRSTAFLEHKKVHFDPLENKQIEKIIAEHKKQRPTIENFADVRPQIDRERDQAYIERRVKDFEQDAQETKRISDALEVVLTEFASSWLPGYASRTSEFDDIANHSDLVLEMENETTDEITRIAVDVTFSKHQTGLKVAEIVKDLHQGLLSRLRYFESELDASREIKFLPRVVLGSDNPGAITSLVRLYLNYQKTKDATKRNMYRKAIEEHPFGKEAFSEVEFQLKRTAEILKTAEGSREDLDRKIAMVQAALDEFKKFKEKKMALAQSDDNAQSHNGVMDAIFQSLESTM